MAYYRPQTELRQAGIIKGHAAIIFIDVQNYNCSKLGGIYKALSKEGKDAAEYFFKRVEEITPHWKSLIESCRKSHVHVIETVIASLRADGQDRSRDYKISGFHVPVGSWDAQPIDILTPQENEILIPKTSSSVFQSTNIHYILQNLEVRSLLIVGCVTDQCVEHAVRDACDLGYLVTLVTDACATYSEERHQASLKAISGYCRQRCTQQVVDELQEFIS